MELPGEQPKEPNRLVNFFKRPEIILAILLLLAGTGIGVGLALRNGGGEQQQTAANRFGTVKIPLSEVLSGKNSELSDAARLTINGPTLFNESITLAPATQPTGATAGQLYYDGGVNQLAYFNGQNFVFLPGDNGPIQGIGAGLTLVNGQLSNGGVLSLQGLDGNITLAGGRGITINGTTISSTGIASVSSGSASLTATTDADGNVIITSNGAGTGTVDSPGGTVGRIAKFTGAQTIADSLLSESGVTVTVGGNLNVTGALTLATPLAVAQGGTGAASLPLNGVVIGQGTGPLIAVTAGAPGECLLSTAGAPAFGACPGGGGGGVTSLNGLTGVLTIANASGVGSTVTINDATTAAKGIASFNATNFSVTGGAVNTAQDIHSGATPTFVGVNTNNITPSAALTVGISAQTALLQGSVTTITSNGPGNDIFLNSADTIELQDNTNVTGNVTTSGDLAVNGGDITSTGALNITPGGTLTVGVTSQTLTLQGGATSSFRATSGANTTIVAFTSPTANTTLNFPALSAGTYTICTTSGNCSGAATTLQGAYDNSSNPEIVLDATRGALTIRDNATPLGANLLEVQNNAGSTTYLAVTSAGILVTGTTSVTGNINTTGGVIQTNSTTRIDNSGNLVNIVALTASGSATFQGGSVTLGTNAQAGSVVINDGSSNTGTLQVAALGQNTVYTLPDPGVGTASICLTTGNCAGVGGGVTSPGGTPGTIAKFTGAQTIGDSLLSEAGATVTVGGNLNITSGNQYQINGTQVTSAVLSNDANLAKLNASQTFTGANAFNGAGTGLSVSNNATVGGTLGVTGNLTTSATLFANAVSVTTNINASGTTTTGVLSVTNNAGVGGILTVSGNAVVQGGDLSVGTVSQTGSLILNDGSSNTGTLTVAALGQNTVYTLPDPGGGTATICLTTGNCSGVGGGVTSPGGTTNRLSKFTGAQTIADSTISDDGTNVTTTVDVIVQGGALTVGTASQPATIVMHDGNGQTTTLQAGDSAGNLTFVLPTTAGAANQCLKQSGVSNQLVWQDCDGGSGGSSATLQTAYNNSTNPEIVLDSGIGGVTIRDNATPIGANLFEVQNNAGSTTYFNVTVGGIGVTGTATATGNVNSSGGNLQTNGTSRIDNAGNAINIGNITGTGAITIASVGAGNDITINGADQFIVQDASVFNATSTFNATVDVGANNIIGTTGDINLTNFDVVGSTGNVTAGTYNGQTISSTANFTGTLGVAGNTTLTGDLAINGGDLTSSGALNITPGGTLTIGSSTQTLTLQGSSASSLTVTNGANTTGITFQAPTANVTYRFATGAAGTYDVCTTIGNCVGGGGGVTTPGGTPGTIAKFTGTQVLGDSLLSEAGATVTVGGNLNITSGNQFQINGTQISSAALSNDANLAKLNATQSFTGNNSFDGNVVLGNAAADLVTFNGTIQGGSPLVFEGTTPDANKLTFVITDPLAPRTVTFGDESGTVCLQGSLNCGFAAGSSASYIQNQNASQQPTSNFWISGTGRADTALQAPLLDTASAGALALGSTNATAINLNQSTVVAATKTLTVTSGLTSLTGNTTGDALNVSNSTSTGNIANFLDNSTAVLTLADGGALTHRTQTNAFGGFLIQDSGGSGIIRVDTTSRKVAIGAHPTSTSDNISGQLQVTPINDARAGVQVKAFGVSYAANYFEAVTSASVPVFQVQSSGAVQNVNGAFSSFAQTAGSTNSANSTFGSGAVAGATSNSGTATFGSGNSTTSGNTGVTTVKSGDATSGNSGNVTIDVGTASGTAGTISIGTANTTGLTIGRTAAAFTLQGSSTSTIKGTSGAFTTTLGFTTPTANRAINLPDEAGTICLQSSVNCGFAVGTSASYIQNQNAGQQVSSNYWISGTGRADTALQAPLLDTATAGALAIGTTNATAINLNQNTTIAATKTLTVTSGLTSLTGNTTGDAFNVSNSTSTGNVAVFKDNATTVATIADGGATTFANSTNSANAFNIQNAANGNIFNVGTIAEPSNQITNGSIEVNTTGYAALGGATVSRVTTQHVYGDASLQTVTGATIGDGWKYNVTLTPSTSYTVSFSAKLSSGTFTNMAFGYSSDGTVPGEANCKTNQTIATNGWRVYACTFTTAASVTGTPYFYAKQATGVARTFWIDGLHMVPGPNIGAYYEGTIVTSTVVTSNFAIQTSVDGQASFQVQSSTGQTVLTTDTANNRVGIGTSGPAAALHVTAGSVSEIDLILGIASGQTGDAFQVRDINQATFTKIDKDSNLTVKPISGAALTFDVQNTSGTSVFSADAAGVRINIGSSVADAVGVILVLDTKNTAGDPTGVDGAMYYNSNLGAFRCYEQGAWKMCGDPRSQTYGYRIDEDFWGSYDADPIGDYGWFAETNGAGSTTYAASEAKRPGIRRQRVSGANERSSLSLGDGASPIGSTVIVGGEVAEFAIKLGTLSTTADRAVFRGGLCDTADVECVNGLYFEYDQGLSTVWRIGASQGGTRSETATGVTVAASTWYTFKIVVNSTSSVEYFINGTSVGTISTAANIPDGAGSSVNPIFQWIKTTNTASTARDLFVDFYTFYNHYSSAR